MATECSGRTLTFQPVGVRQVVGKFDGGKITSDGGGLLLKEVERRSRIIEQFAGCFVDHRDPALIEHRVQELVAQRVYGLALGYEDLNDHDDLRLDPLLAVLVGKADVTGEQRARRRDKGKALAGKSTLNRLELTSEKVEPKERYKKIGVKREAVDRFFVDVFIQSQPDPPRRLVLDPGRDRRYDPWESRRAILSWILRELLLSAALHFLRRASVVRTATAVEYRCLGGCGARVGTNRCTASGGVAGGGDRDPRRLGVCARRVDGVV